MKDLELLAPARNADIGIAAIDCGADAVYMAGPGFGARQAAGNSVDDIRRVCAHAHRFGARVFVTVNTIIYDDELERVRQLVADVREAGADALIVQDMALVDICRDMDMPLHASTQCAIRTPEKASWLASAGFSRLILERQLSLEEIRSVADAVPECEIEFFVHGALCVSFSGQCWLSENIAGRSANRGCCIQACRSRYDLADETGKIIVKDKALLSLKDYSLIPRLGDLAEAGVSSFKIEGRLKNESYVRNVVRACSEALDRVVASHPELYRRASFGTVTRSFTPAPDKTFNRGYTELFIDGRKPSGQRRGPSGWASMDAAKGMGELLGKVYSVKKDLRRQSTVIEVETPRGCALHNGDGFSFVAGDGEAVGFRGDVCENMGGSARISFRGNDCNIYKGATLLRNLDVEFEKEIARNPGTRMLSATVDVTVGESFITACATSEDGRQATKKYTVAADRAVNRERIESLVRNQIGKSSGIWNFTLGTAEFTGWPLLGSAFLNGIRRDLAEALDGMPCKARPLGMRRLSRPSGPLPHDITDGTRVTYKANAANALAEEILRGCGAETVDPAYELRKAEGAELMRSRYCIRRELGMCLKEGGRPGRLFLLNNGRRLALSFDCRACEMTVSEG